MFLLFALDFPCAACRQTITSLFIPLRRGTVLSPVYALCWRAEAIFRIPEISLRALSLHTTLTRARTIIKPLPRPASRVSSARAQTLAVERVPLLSRADFLPFRALLISHTGAGLFVVHIAW